MPTISAESALAVAVVNAIQRGRIEELRRLLAANPWLATARVGAEASGGEARTLLHVVADWPGHFPRGAATVKLLVAAGAEVDAPFHGAHAETPLHWAASSGDVEVLDALLDAGANIEAPGSVLGGGSPLTDAVGFKQWAAARRLVDRGAQTTVVSSAALGLVDRLRAELAGDAVAQHSLDHAFWAACDSGQHAAARLLLDRAPISIGSRSGGCRYAARCGFGRRSQSPIAAWLRELGAKSANALDP